MNPFNYHLFSTGTANYMMVVSLFPWGCGAHVYMGRAYTFNPKGFFSDQICLIYVLMTRAQYD